MADGERVRRGLRRLLEEQKRRARGQRLEMLGSDLSGTKKMLEEAVWPAFRSLSGNVLEHEVVGSGGYRYYIDAFYAPLRIAFESEGFVIHAEKLTRGDFMREKRRVRAFAARGMEYYPFCRDELDKFPELCRQDLFEYLGRRGSSDNSIETYSVFEREVLRHGLVLNRPIKLADVKHCLDCKYERAHRVIRSMIDKGFIVPRGRGKVGFHEYEITPKGRDGLR